jgi:hypothetical protein
MSCIGQTFYVRHYDELITKLGLQRTQVHPMLYNFSGVLNYRFTNLIYLIGKLKAILQLLSISKLFLKIIKLIKSS